MYTSFPPRLNPSAAMRPKPSVKFQGNLSVDQQNHLKEVLEDVRKTLREGFSLRKISTSPDGFSQKFAFTGLSGKQYSITTYFEESVTAHSHFVKSFDIIFPETPLFPQGNILDIELVKHTIGLLPSVKTLQAQRHDFNTTTIEPYLTLSEEEASALWESFLQASTALKASLRQYNAHHSFPVDKTLVIS